ncbi:MAG: hypothetical protein EAZ61_02580 [Oscillatoriales cyanobacterium]|nr:MAG: hypothetical protein EAZ61_02580 [Oscillatoriales cyanobacterium]
MIQIAPGHATIGAIFSTDSEDEIHWQVTIGIPKGVMVEPDPKREGKAVLSIELISIGSIDRTADSSQFLGHVFRDLSVLRSFHSASVCL